MLAAIGSRLTMCHCRHQSQNLTETVVHGRRTTDDVLLGQTHALTDEKAIVQDISMGQTRSLGRRSRPGGKLDVDQVFGMDRLGRSKSFPSPEGCRDEMSIFVSSRFEKSSRVHVFPP